MITVGEDSRHERSLVHGRGGPRLEGMTSLAALRASAVLSLLAAGGDVGCRARTAPDGVGSGAASTADSTDSSTHRPLTLDVHQHPDLRFRIDAFTVPAASRSEFEAIMHRNLAFLETLPGFQHHVVFEKTDGPTTFDVVTIAVWESPEAIAAASEKVRAYYKSIGLDLPATITRLGITASLGYYRAPEELQ
jgi:hypothetical protein